MSHQKRAPFVALIALLHRRYPHISNHAGLIREGLVLVDGAPALNVEARVRSDASIRLLRTSPLRGTIKLERALDAFALDIAGMVALDLGAGAGGFTRALLDAGVARIYAVDAGIGQLRGGLRLDPRVISLEGTNLSTLDCSVIPDVIDLVTMDLSYLAVAGAAPQLHRLRFAADARMVALVKPTFELHAPTLAIQPDEIAQAVTSATKGLLASGWVVLAVSTSPIAGSRGAIEVFLYAHYSTSTS